MPAASMSNSNHGAKPEKETGDIFNNLILSKVTILCYHKILIGKILTDRRFKSWFLQFA
jgi:hypothetical protein